MLKQIAALSCTAILIVSCNATTVQTSPVNNSANSLQAYVNDLLIPRHQWNAYNGYCGEVSLITAGLSLGQYLSQYDVRRLTTMNQATELLLGGTGIQDMLLAATTLKMVPSSYTSPNTSDFLVWVKKNVVAGHPTIIGVFNNENTLYGSKNCGSEGDPEYDHIVPIMGISSTNLASLDYLGDDQLTLIDNGLYGSGGTPYSPPNYPNTYSYTFDSFAMTRENANCSDGPIYALISNGNHYGLTILGIADTHSETFPIQISTDLNYECPEINDGISADQPNSNCGVASLIDTRPNSQSVTLTVTISNLTPGSTYNLYDYGPNGDFELVPSSDFNSSYANSPEKTKKQTFQASATTYSFTRQIKSDQIVIYRCVQATPS